MSVFSRIDLPQTVRAITTGRAHWISICDQGGNEIHVICPNAEVARATAEAWNDAMAYSQAEADA